MCRTGDDNIGRSGTPMVAVIAMLELCGPCVQFISPKPVLGSCDFLAAKNKIKLFLEVMHMQSFPDSCRERSGCGKQ